MTQYLLRDHFDLTNYINIIWYINIIN